MAMNIRESRSRFRSSPKRDQGVVNAMADIMSASPTMGQTAYRHSLLCHLHFPRSRPNGDVSVFSRTSGRATLSLLSLDQGSEASIPLPFGSMARALVTHLGTLAVRTQSPLIDVGPSARCFLGAMGKRSSGGQNGSLTSLREQMAALSNCSLALQMDKTEPRSACISRVLESLYRQNNGPTNSEKWQRYIRLGQPFFESLLLHAVPLDMRALAALSDYPLAYDVYTWLAERLHRTKGTQFIPWCEIHRQFGTERTGKHARRDMVTDFQRALFYALSVYPAAKVRAVNGGVALYRSPPPVPYRGDA